MTINEDEIIKTIIAKVPKGPFHKDVHTATDPSLNRQEKAYALGLFFKKIKADQDLYTSLNNDFGKLADTYKALDLDKYFSLKIVARKQTKTTIYEITLGLISIVFIVAGLTRPFSYSILHTKSNTPVSVTGISVICLGLILIYITFSFYQRRQRLKVFYLNSNGQNNGGHVSET